MLHESRDEQAGNSGTPAASAGVATMPIRLRTSLPGCSIPYVPYMVPVTWRRSQLSTLVNKVLATAHAGDDTYKAVPFDFIVNGTLLRTSLEEYLAQHGDSAETTLELEYIKSTLPPAFKDAARQDDWVASVDARHASSVLTASFDGIVRVFDAEALSTRAPHAYTPAYSSHVSLTCAKWLSDDAKAVATGSMSGTVAVWRVPGTQSTSIPILRAAELEHHTLPVSSIDVAASHAMPNRAAVLSAGWDGSLALWDVPMDAEFEMRSNDGESGTKKRRKHGGSAESHSAASTSLVAPPPTMVLEHVTPALGATAARSLHTAPIPGQNARTFATFADGDRCIWSAAWDGTVKRWDVTAGGVLSGQKQTDKVPLCVSAFSAHQLVCGHMDHSLALYDFRDTVSNAAVAMNGAHTAPVSAVKVHPRSEHLFASGAYDGRLKVWDVRSPKQALFAVTAPVAASKEVGGQTKVLGLDWTPSGDALVAGGEDCRVCLYQARQA